MAASVVGFVAGFGFLVDLMGFWGVVVFDGNMVEMICCCCCFLDGAVGFFGGDVELEDCMVSIWMRALVVGL